MQDAPDPLALELVGLSRADWLRALQDLGEARGFLEPLGAAHHALFVEDGDTLVVTFESLPAIQALSEDGAPVGLEFVRELGWSQLAVISDRDTWFRDPDVYKFFDQLNDDGFFDDFEQVVFFGAGPCGYAAAAYSVACPGARVVAVQPQATLDPRLAGWDERFADKRRLCFTDRYGYAPEMLDAADHAFILYDPHEPLDAMHAALFHRSNVTRFRLPFMGSALLSDLLELDLLLPLLTSAAEGSLDVLTFSGLMRVRRDHPPYLRKLLARLESDGRSGLSEMLCENVVARMQAPRFRRKLEALRAARKATGSGTSD
ncbi:phosphoadenosine phosphosulfate reductase [Puniceibacterium confluentis]|uniref:phosphoadenosine phosphosulfate reductase n=1 Tax=Puniceibacterium confluentis TaxID=1958944 RepID=UPI0011B55F33|nr:phosphoadenosine phosphosulfate reductase [Puniceibacterium confluentis]